jgi:phage baseplate assembly protein W
MDYYKVPINLGSVIKNKDCAMCSLKESVAGMIHLIATTSFGECKHDESFGCGIWDHDFENISNAEAFKESVKGSMASAIARYEKRIEYVNIDVEIEQVMTMVKRRKIKNRIVLNVKGKLVKTNEDFKYNETFFIGPLSYF